MRRFYRCVGASINNYNNAKLIVRRPEDRQQKRGREDRAELLGYDIPGSQIQDEVFPVDSHQRAEEAAAEGEVQ